MTEKRSESQFEMAQETARISWPELERHFARGVVIHVHSSLDLVSLAGSFVDDKVANIEQLLKEKNIEHLTVETAKDWCLREPELWAVVTAPWILVQERK